MTNVALLIFAIAVIVGWAIAEEAYARHRGGPPRGGDGGAT